mmetsp:Transcript_23077/g.47981  ORF Transcript_23077/g.47981 Transcript_23077/m.47981 type:complete len:91 (-) Transcript_23077:133-405(-)
MASGSNAPEGATPSPSPTGSRGSGHSIIKGKSGRNMRSDSFGTAIEKGKKAHRCSFADERDAKKSVEERIEVTSYKGADVDNDAGCCSLM